MYLILNNNKIPIKKALSFKEKLTGLSLKENINYGLYIPNCNHIHTFFMYEDIDVLYLNENNMIIYKYMAMPPKRTFKVYEDINKTSVLELPKYTSKNLKIGDTLVFEDEHII